MEKETKNQVLNIRITSQEKERLKQYAAEQGVSMSELILKRLDDILHPYGKY